MKRGEKPAHVKPATRCVQAEKRTLQEK